MVSLLCSTATISWKERLSNIQRRSIRLQSKRHSIFRNNKLICREGFTRLFKEHVSPSTSIHYHRINSFHYSIPSYECIQKYFCYCYSYDSFTCSFISFAKSFNHSTMTSPTFVLLAHNINGLSFHMPLLYLIFSHQQHNTLSTEIESKLNKIN